MSLHKKNYKTTHIRANEKCISLYILSLLPSISLSILYNLICIFIIQLLSWEYDKIMRNILCEDRKEEEEIKWMSSFNFL